MGRKPVPKEVRKIPIPCNLYEQDVLFIRDEFVNGYASFIRDAVHVAVMNYKEMRGYSK